MTESLDDELLVKEFNQGYESAFDRIVEGYSAAIAVLVNGQPGWPGSNLG